MPRLQIFDEKPQGLVESKLHKLSPPSVMGIGNKTCLLSTCLQMNQRRMEMH